MTVLRATLIGMLLGAATLFGAFALATRGQTPASAAPVTAALAAPAAGAVQLARQADNPYAATFVQALATHLGLTGAQVTAAYSGAMGDALAQAVKDGKLTQAQATKLTQGAQQMAFPALGFAKMIGAPAGGMTSADRQAALVHPTLAALAPLFGLSTDALRAQVTAGKSLAEIAQAHNVPLAQVKATILTAAKAALDAGVKSGQWTQAQADETYRALPSQIDANINAPLTLPARQAHVVVLPGAAAPAGAPAKGGILPLPPGKMDWAIVSGSALAAYGPAFVRAFTSRLGVTEARLTTAFGAAVDETLAQMVQDGQLTQPQATELKTMSQKMGLAALGFPGLGGGLRPNNGEALRLDLTALAPLFGMTPAELKTALHGGQTLAGIAQARHVDLQKVQDALLAPFKADLDAAVKAGTLTQVQAAQNYHDAGQKISLLITRPLPGGLEYAQPNGNAAREEALIAPVAAAVAPLLGLSAGDLIAQLKGGATLTGLAQAHHVDVATVRTAVLTAAQAALAAGVKSGRWTQGQANETNRDMATRIDSVMTQPLK